MWMVLVILIIFLSSVVLAQVQEVCNSMDDNGNGFTDEGCDDDNDGYCDSSMGFSASDLNVGAGSYPDINGNKIVYSSGAVPMVQMYDISTGLTTTNIVAGASPRIYGNWIISRTTGVSEVPLYKYNLATGIRSTITTTAPLYADPTVGYDIYNNLAVYINGVSIPPSYRYDLRVHNLDTGADTLIAQDVWSLVDIYNNFVVYKDATPTGNLYLHNINTGAKQVIATGTNINQASIYGDYVAYTRWSAGSYTVYLYQISSGTTNTVATSSDAYVQAGNDIVLFGNGYCKISLNGQDGGCLSTDQKNSPGGRGSRTYGNYIVYSGVYLHDMNSNVVCTQPGDCNDANYSINPGATEICDNADNNCDGQINEGCDDDDDDYCDNAMAIVGIPDICLNGGNDCNDIDINVYPSASDICDSIDNDCNPLTPDGSSETYYEPIELSCDNLDNNCNGIIDDLPAAPSAGEVLIDINSQDVSAVRTPTGYGVVWQQADADGWQVYFVETDLAGAKKTSPVKISTSSSPMQSWQPSVAYDGANFGIAWEEHDLNVNTDYEVYFALVDGTDYSVTAPQLVSEGDNLRSFLPEIAWSGSSYGIVWLDAKGADFVTSTNIFFREVNADRSMLPIKEKITANNRAQGFLSLAWNPANSQYVAAWENNIDANNYEIYISLFNSDGTNIIEKGVTNQNGRSQYPSVIWNNDLNEYGLVWQDTKDFNNEIYFTRLNAGGNKLIGDIRLTNNAASSQYPSIAWNGDEYGVSWMEGTGVYYIYFTRVKPGNENMNMADIQMSDTQVISWLPKILWGGSSYITFYYDTQKIRYITFESCGVPVVCGDGVLAASEQCDDGNTISEDGCSNACEIEVCGDGTLQLLLGEQCDDGNIISGDGCNEQCGPEYCGDNIIQQGLGEQCDDGNTLAGDGCSAACTIEPIIKFDIPKIAIVYKAVFDITGISAVNPKVDVGDDGTYEWQYPGTLGQTVTVSDLSTAFNDYITDVCTAGIDESCQIPVALAADSGTLTVSNINIQYVNYWWDTSLLPNGFNYRVMVVAEEISVCGNRKIEAAEQCDDGNTIAGDGCSATCTRE